MSSLTLRLVKGSALTYAEADANFTNLNTDKLQNVVEDTTPQLGGSLDVNGNSIVSTSNGNITLTPNGTGKVVINGHESIIGGNSLFLWDSGNANAPSIYAPSDAIAFKNNAGSELMRINSTGLGVGTSSPVSGTKLTLQESASNPTALALLNRNSTQTWKVAVDAASVDDKILAFIDNGTSTVRMALTDTGNLGLGVTPSAWGSTRKAMQIGGANGGYVTADNGLAIASNYAYTTADIFVANGYAPLYFMSSANGQHQWYISGNNASGAGASWTPTQAMTLDASGNLGIGTTSPAVRLDVSASGYSARFYGDASNYLRVYCGSTYQVLESNGTNQFGYVNGAFFVQTAGTERARITSSGDLLVGCTSLPAGNRTKGFAARDNSTGGFQTYQTASSSDWAISASSGSICNFYSDNGSALVLAGQILVNGNITTYSSISDYRLKENVQPMVGALDKVQALKPVTYTFKNSGQISQGFIAHELAEVCPQAVTGEKDAVDAEGNPQYQGINTSFLVATLTAAIQELKAEFDAYKASHP